MDMTEKDKDRFIKSLAKVQEYVDEYCPKPDVYYHLVGLQQALEAAVEHIKLMKELVTKSDCDEDD